MARVVLHNLVKRYPGSSGAQPPVVGGISLEIRDGELMVLVGPSGCGKSTTLRMIAGLEGITSGTVAIDGQTVNDVPPKDRDIAMVFQNYALYPHLSVFENMAFGLRMRHFPRDEIERRVREAAGLLGLDGCLDRRPRELSGGQRQRVALGRAIVRKPKVFLFDEPLSNLDARMRASTRAEIARLHARLGTTIIYVTHDQVEAMTLGDRICVMRGGEIMQVGEPMVIYERPANLFVAGFIGSPPMNLFKGLLQSTIPGTAQVQIALGPDASHALELPAGILEKLDPTRSSPSPAAQPVVLGIRPENLHDARDRSAPDPGRTLELTPEIVEPMGAETLLHGQTAAGPWSARLPPVRRYAAGTPVPLWFDTARIRLFDAESGRAFA